MQPAARTAKCLAAALLLSASAGGCRGEAEQRARRLGQLRRAAVEGLEAVHRYCDARDSATAAFNRGEAGWEPALEEMLRGTFALDDYCEEGRGSHEHDEPPADTAQAADSTRHGHQP